MARIKVKILKDCVLWIAWNEMNILESQLPRFKDVCEVIKWEPKKKETPKKEIKKGDFWKKK